MSGEHLKNNISENEKSGKGQFRKGKSKNQLLCKGGVWKRTIMERTNLKKENYEQGNLKKEKYEKEKSEKKGNCEKENVAVNKSDIAVNKSDIAVNKSDISFNTSDIAVNTVTIPTWGGGIREILVYSWLCSVAKKQSIYIYNIQYNGAYNITPN